MKNEKGMGLIQLIVFVVLIILYKRIENKIMKNAIK